MIYLTLLFLFILVHHILYVLYGYIGACRILNTIKVCTRCNMEMKRNKDNYITNMISNKKLIQLNKAL